MKKAIAVALSLGLLTGALAMPAQAGKKKKAKPVQTTLFMHGDVPVGDLLEWIEGVSGGTHNKMDTTEPAAGPPKSHSYTLDGIGNTQCTGNELFPSWEGQVAGTIVGDLKLYANTLAPPSKVIARVWVDVPFGSCSSSLAGVDDFVDPIAEQEVDVPAGANELEIVFENLKVPAQMNLIVMLHQQGAPQNQGRVLYDSPDFPTRVVFDCIPPKGEKACA